jgi:cbb3-type cytochrome oxidase maturation protein
MYVLLPAALLFAIAAVVVFAWAARSGQFDDLETPAVRILGDDDSPTVAASLLAREASEADATGTPRTLKG